MRRFACTVLFTCGLLVCSAAQSHAYYQDKTKDSSQASTGEDATKGKSQAPPSTPANATAKTPPRQPPAPRVDVKAPQIGVKGGQIGITSPQIRGTAPQIGVTSPQVRTNAPRIDRNGVPLPGGTRGTVNDPYGTGMGVYVPMQLPAREAEEAPPAYGNVPVPAPSAPASVAIPAYDAGDAKPKDAAGADYAVPVPAPSNEDARAPRTSPVPSAATPAPVPLPAQLSGRFAGVQGRTLHTWEFRPDGTFEHAWTDAANSSGSANVEAGTFSVIGPYLTLAVWGRAATRSAAPARASQQIRRHRLGMLGTGAANAIMLDGLMLKPQNE